VLPDSGFIQAVHHGKRTSEEADEFVAAIKENSDGEAPLFLSDGWSRLRRHSKKIYCSWEPVPYSGVGRPYNPIQIVDPKLKYAQVIKRKENGKLVDIEKRVILGEEQEILDIIQAEGRAKTINTSYVESRNGNYRKDNKRLTRRTQCHSKKVCLHDAQIYWITAVYIFATEITRHRECINQEAKRFETKYKKSSPAMAENLVNRIFSIEELLMLRVP